MSINDLFKKANKSFTQKNHIEGLKIYKHILSKYPQNLRLSEEVKKTTQKYKKIINQTISDKEISNFFNEQDLLKIIDPSNYLGAAPTMVQRLFDKRKLP